MSEQKIVVINSFGPMGSTVCASIIEKFGYLNIPLRKLGLHEYLLGKRDLNDRYMINRLQTVLMSHSKHRQQGGVSVIHRDSSLPVLLTDTELVSEDLVSLTTFEPKSLSELYYKIRDIYVKAVIYKEIKIHSYNKQIELTTDIRLHSPEKLYDAYLREFKNVKMIHLKRDFISWINSYASQWFATPYYSSVMKYLNLDAIQKTYDQYQKTISELPGLTIDTKELLLPNTNNTIKRLSEYLEEEIPLIEWKKEKYDLYGRISDFSTTFTPFDSRIDHLTKPTKHFIRKYYYDKKLNFIEYFVLNTFYLFDHLTHRVRCY